MNRACRSDGSPIRVALGGGLAVVQERAIGGKYASKSSGGGHPFDHYSHTVQRIKDLCPVFDVFCVSESETEG